MGAAHTRVGEDARLVCVGSYCAESGGRGRGITLFRRDLATGKLAVLSELALASPSYLAWHRRLPIIYAVSEVQSGRIHAVRRDESGALCLIGSVASGGDAPCHLAVTPDGRYLLCANYGGGGVTVLPVAPDGTLHDAIDSAAHTRPHMALPNDGNSVLTTDLALDQVRRYRVDEQGRLELDRVWQLPADTGPRHLARDPGRDRLYILGELDSSVSILDASGAVIRYAATSMTSTARNFPAHLEYHRTPDLLVVSNRGADCITTVRATSRGLHNIGEYSAGGAWPRHFATVGNWLYVAAERADTITCFAIDPRTAQLTTRPERIAVGSPACIAPGPIGAHVPNH